MQCMLEVKNVSVNISGNTILENVSFVVRGNSLFYIKGANGSGKTVLLKCILGLAKHSSGTNVLNLPRSKVGVLLEYPTFYPDMTVADNLKIFSKYKGLKEIEENLVGSFSLNDLLQKKGAKLSLGQKQRQGLAKAFMGSPKLVLLDEPFSNLAEQSKIALKEHMTAYVSNGSPNAIVFTSHEDYFTGSLFDTYSL